MAPLYSTLDDLPKNPAHPSPSSTPATKSIAEAAETPNRLSPVKVTQLTEHQISTDPMEVHEPVRDSVMPDARPIKPTDPHSSSRSPVRLDVQKDNRVDVRLYLGNLASVRKAVREIGKERSEMIVSRTEKNALRELAFAYTQAGVRTSINEIVRIAVNWLLEDYKARKKESILAQTLEAIHD